MQAVLTAILPRKLGLASCPGVAHDTVIKFQLYQNISPQLPHVDKI